MAKLVNAEQTRVTSTRSRQYADDAISDLAQIVLGALDDARAHTLTLQVQPDNWNETAGEWVCDIPVPGMTAQTIVLAAAESAPGVLALQCESRQDALRLFADEKPSASITLQCAMVQPGEEEAH